MSEYKKKKVHRLSALKRGKKAGKHRYEAPEDIPMSPSRSPGAARRKKREEPEGIRVVPGKKQERKRRTRRFLVGLAAVLAVVTALQLLLPAGIGEALENGLAMIGSGQYPIELAGTETLDCVSRSGYYYVLDDASLSAFTNAGKELWTLAHGYENPVLKTSKTRALLFDQGGTQLQIYNRKSRKRLVTTEKEIITAAISDSGVYAVVTHADSYASAVTVYSKNGNRLYEWYSATDTVNDVAISPNGKKIAVSAFNAATGQFVSRVSVLNYQSATPLFTETYDGTLIYHLDASHRTGFSVVTSHKVSFIKWSNYQKTDYQNDYQIGAFRAGTNGSLAVFHRASDKTDNKIVVFTSRGKLKKELEYHGTIDDIQLSGGHIYGIGDAGAFLLDRDGRRIGSAACGFGAVRMAVTGTKSVAVMINNQIEKIKLEREQ